MHFFGGICKKNTIWSGQSSSTTNDLEGVSCVNNNWCVAVGGHGAILGWNGTAWSNQSSSTTNDLYGMSCVITSQCLAVGRYGTILAQREINASDRSEYCSYLPIVKK